MSQPDEATGSRGQEYREQQRRDRGARSDLPTRLAWIIGLAGLLVAAFVAMSGDAPVIVSIAAGSCLAAGLLFSVSHEGRDGAIVALMLPLVVALTGLLAVIASIGTTSVSDGLQLLAFGMAPIVLFIAACTEVGYFAGRLVARLIRALRDGSS